MRTKRKTVLKLGPLEISRRIPVQPARPSARAKEARQSVSETAALQLVQSEAKPRTSAEAGVAGNTSYHGFDGAGEYLQELVGPEGRGKLDEMRRSDPAIRSTLQAVTLPIRQNDYSVAPGAAGTPRAIEIAEIVGRNLFREMHSTWDDVMRHALLMLPFGFSILEKVWMIGKDGLIKVKKLDARLPQSIFDWKYDKAKRRLVGAIQADTDGTKYLLPIEKILVFTLEKEGDNWEGLSMLRPVYKPWFLKNTLEKINGIKHERHGVGVPKVTVPSGTTRGSQAWNDAIEIAESLIAHEAAYAIVPEGYDVDLLGAGGDKGTDALPTIKYYDEVIAKAALAMFISLGTSQSGSRALGDSFIDLFFTALQATADYICEVITRYLLREYVDLNWNVDEDEYPTLQAGQIKKLDPQTLAVLKNAGLITTDLEVENAVRRMLHLNEKTEEQWEEEKAAKQAIADRISGKAPAEEEKEEEDPATEEEDEQEEPDTDGDEKKLALREPKPEEQIPDCIGIEAELNAKRDSLAEILLEHREVQINTLIRQVVGGISIQKLEPSRKGDMHKDLMAAYRAAEQDGRMQVREELQSQAGQGPITLAEAGDQAALKALASEELSIIVEGLSSKLASLLATEAVDLKRQGFTGAALEAALRTRIQERLSDAAWIAAAETAVNRGWGAGREEEIELNSPKIAYVYYSAILDRQTCMECYSKDGKTHAPDDARYRTPNPDCFGKGRCRCMNIAVLKEETGVEG